MPDEPTSPPPSKARWTRRRILSTGINAFAGFGIALLLPPLAFGIFAIVFGVLGQPIHFALPAAILGSFWQVWQASTATCKGSPAAPVGIAWGLGLGGATLAIVVGFNATNYLLYVFATTLLAPALAYAGFSGATRGLHKNLGKPQPGKGRTCATCGYDLSATPDHWPCPECAATLRYPNRPGEAF